MDDLLIKFFNKNNINYQNEKFVIAVSTGVDSSVLLDLFLKEKTINNDNIIICHVNHHKRKESDIEEQYIKEYSKKNNIKLYVKDLFFDDSIDNFQSEARKKRYEFFYETMDKEKASYLVLAHHALDLMETILLRMTRGSSLAGYAGINECYEFKHHNIIRPLLNISKEDIYNYAKTNNIKYFEDESNSSNLYTRNKIRHEIIPKFEENFPNILDKFYEYSKVLLQASKEIDSYRDSFISKYVYKDNIVIRFKKTDFNTISDYLKQEVVFELLKPFMLSKPHIDEILNIIKTKDANFVHKFNNDFTLIIEYDNVIFDLENNDINNEKISILVDKVGIYSINDKTRIIVNNGSSNVFTKLNELWYNTDRLPIIIRNRIPGDKIFINQNYKKVKDVMIDMKVPITKRNKLLLGVDKDGEVLIIFGLRKSDNLNKLKTNDICIYLEEENNYE